MHQSYEASGEREPQSPNLLDCLRFQLPKRTFNFILEMDHKYYLQILPVLFAWYRTFTLQHVQVGATVQRSGTYNLFTKHWWLWFEMQADVAALLVTLLLEYWILASLQSFIQLQLCRCSVARGFTLIINRTMSSHSTICRSTSVGHVSSIYVK